MRKFILFTVCMGMILSAPHALFGYDTSSTSSVPTVPSLSSSSSNASTIPLLPQKVEKLNVDINALRAQLQQRNQKGGPQSATQNRRHPTVQPVDTWEHTIRTPQ